MNIANMNALLARLEWLRKSDAKPTIGFNMALFFSSSLPDHSGHGCGTVACIAGHACMLKEEQEEGKAQEFSDVWIREWYKKYWMTPTNQAWVGLSQAWLGLSSEEARILFMPPMGLKQIQLARAITALKRAIEGEPAQTWWHK